MINPNCINRESLTALYLDWVNNYMTLALFAEHHGLHIEESEKLIELARAIACIKHPEA